MLTKEIIQRILSLYGKGVQSDDSRLTTRHIYNKMSSVRSKLLTQELKKKQKVNQWNYMTIPCIELVLAPRHECPCLPQTGCNILKSKYRLPKPLTSLVSHSIQEVMSIDGAIRYDEILANEVKNRKGAKYTANKPDFWIQNGYLYLTHRGGPKVVTMTMLPEDPLEVTNFPSYCSSDCVDCQDVSCVSPLDEEFPIDQDMIDTLIELCANELVVTFSKTQEDITNDTRDSSLETTK